MRAKKADRNLRHFQFSDLPIRLRCSCSSSENLFDIFLPKFFFFALYKFYDDTLFAQILFIGTIQGRPHYPHSNKCSMFDTFLPITSFKLYMIQGQPHQLQEFYVCCQKNYCHHTYKVDHMSYIATRFRRFCGFNY